MLALGWSSTKKQIKKWRSALLYLYHVLVLQYKKENRSKSNFCTTNATIPYIIAMGMTGKFMSSVARESESGKIFLSQHSYVNMF